MVRQEDRPARRRAMVLLDPRAGGHRGSGASSSFEWAVSAAASVVAHLADSAMPCTSSAPRRSTTAGPPRPPTPTRPRLCSPRRRPRPGERRAGAAAAHPVTASGGLVVAVLADRDEESLRQVASLRQPGGSGLAIVLDTATFAGPAPPSSDSRAESMAGLVAAAGWSTVVVRAGTGVGAVWSALTASSGVTVGVRR